MYNYCSSIKIPRSINVSFQNAHIFLRHLGTPVVGANRVNVEYKHQDEEENKKGYVDFDRVDNIKILDINEEIYQVDSDYFESSQQIELENWKQNQVHDEIPYSEEKTVSLKWVCSLKNVDNKTISKSWLAAKGLEEINYKQIPKDSPKCSKKVFQTMLALIAQKKWKLNAIDIKTAFLQGDKTDREIYDMPPKEANTTNVWQLKKCIYGLGDASHKWYNRVKTYLLSIGLVMSKANPALFHYHDNNILIGMIAIYTC